MVDGWSGIAGEIMRLKPLIIFKLKDMFLVKTEKDREEAMDPGSIGFDTSEPQIQLYFLLGLVYAVVTPFLLPFIIVFFAMAYIVYRHQVYSFVLPSNNIFFFSFPISFSVPCIYDFESFRGKCSSFAIISYKISLVFQRYDHVDFSIML